MTRPYPRFLLMAAALTLSPGFGGRAAGQADAATAAEARQRASAFFRAGQASFNEKDYPAAARSFEAAHETLPSGKSLYNAGRAWEAAQVSDRAANAYAAALEEPDLAGAQAAHARTRLEDLRQGLGVLAVQGPAGARVSLTDGTTRALPARLYVQPGRHELLITFAGGAQRRTSAVVGRAGVVTVTSPPSLARTGAEAASPSRHGAQPGTWLGWTGAAVAIVAASTATALGVATLSARDAYAETDFTSRVEHDRAIDLKTATNIAWAGAALGAGLAVVGFWHVWFPQRTSERLSLSLGPGTLLLQGGF